MTWVRIDDAVPTHPKIADAGPEAAWLWVCGLAYCNRHHTDGRIGARRLAGLYPGQWSAEECTALANRLVDVRLWERDGEDYLVHDYMQFQAEAAKEKVEARREYERQRKADQRAVKKTPKGANEKPSESMSRTSPGHVPDMSHGTPAGTPPGQPQGTDPPPLAEPSRDTDVSQPPVPSRPVPFQTPNGVLSGDGKPPADVEPIKLTEPPAKAAKKPRKEPRDPPPFSIGQAFEALASASNGRFAAGVERDWTQGIRIAVAKLIRQYPDLGAWKVVGEWLAAGGEHFRGVVGPSWAAGTTMANAMAIAMEWNGKGRGPVRPEPRSPGLFESQKPRGLATSTPARVLPAPPPKSLDEARAATARGLEATIAMKASLAAMAAAKEITHG